MRRSDGRETCPEKRFESVHRQHALTEHARADRTKGKTGLTTEEREELTALRKERAVKMERDIVGKPWPSPRRRTQEVCVHPGGEGRVPRSVLCRVLRVTRPGFYAWCRRPESNRSRAARRLAVLVRAAHEESRRSYGSTRLVRELRVVHGERVGRKRMRRLMVQEGLEARGRRRYTCTTKAAWANRWHRICSTGSSRPTSRTSAALATRPSSSSVTEE